MQTIKVVHKGHIDPKRQVQGVRMFTESVYKVSDIFISECSVECSVQLSNRHQSPW